MLSLPHMNDAKTGILVRTSPHPWYEPPKTAIARLFQAIGIKIGLVDPETVPAPRFRWEGYRIEELGPVRWENGECSPIFFHRPVWLSLLFFVWALGLTLYVCS